MAVEDRAVELQLRTQVSVEGLNVGGVNLTLI